jgi:general secretion pathway protein I
MRRHKAAVGNRGFWIFRRFEDRGCQPRLWRRGAFTLLELVLAIALFLGAITVLAQIVWNGQRAAIQARLRTEAAFRCESKLNELLTGAERFQSQQQVAFPDDGQWTWSSQVAAGQFPDLLHLKVTVHRQSNTPAARTEYSLERWLRDPAIVQNAAANQSASKTTQSSSAAAPTPTATGTTGGSK